MRLGGGGGAGTGAMSRQYRAPASDIVIWLGHEMCDTSHQQHGAQPSQKYNRPYHAESY